MRTVAPMPRGLATLGFALLFVAMGCASTETQSRDQLQGTAGPITWAVSDIGRLVSSENQRIRWSYLITLRNSSDRAFQLERVERALTAQSPEMVGGSPTSTPFWRTLGARSELRVPTSDSWGWASTANSAFGGAATLKPVLVFRRFSGKEDKGAPIDILVRVRLDSSVGQLARPPRPPAVLPPSKSLEGASMASLVGRWRGSYRQDGTLIDVPLSVTVRPDGTFEFSENEPPTNSFDRPFQVKNGQLEYTGSRGRATLTLHDGGSKRMLVGHLVDTDVRLGLSGAPEARYAIYLEAAGG
jgi:hypothetical protein